MLFALFAQDSSHVSDSRYLRETAAIWLSHDDVFVPGLPIAQREPRRRLFRRRGIRAALRRREMAGLAIVPAQRAPREAGQPLTLGSEVVIRSWLPGEEEELYEVDGLIANYRLSLVGAYSLRRRIDFRVERRTSCSRLHVRLAYPAYHGRLGHACSTAGSAAAGWPAPSTTRWSTSRAWSSTSATPPVLADF